MEEKLLGLLVFYNFFIIFFGIEKILEIIVENDKKNGYKIYKKIIKLLK